MSRSGMWWLAKGLEGVGLLIVLVGVVMSISLGFEDEGLGSMAIEMKALLVGGAMFLVGLAIERRLGTR